MGKKRRNHKKESLNAFKVSEGRAKKAKTNKANIKFKKFNTKTNEDVDRLNRALNGLESDLRAGKPKQTLRENIAKSCESESIGTDVDVDEAIDRLSGL